MKACAVRHTTLLATVRDVTLRAFDCAVISGDRLKGNCKQTTKLQTANCKLQTANCKMEMSRQSNLSGFRVGPPRGGATLRPLIIIYQVLRCTVPQSTKCLYAYLGSKSSETWNCHATMCARAIGTTEQRFVRGSLANFDDRFGVTLVGSSLLTHAPTVSHFSLLVSVRRSSSLRSSCAG